MADQSITQLPVALSLTGDEQTVVVQNGVTKQASVTQIANAASPGKLITNSSYDPATGYLTFYYSDGTTSSVGPIAGSPGPIGGSGFSGYSGKSGYSGYSGGPGASGISGYSGSGISGYSGAGFSGYSGYSGISGINGMGVSGYSGYSGGPGASGISGYSGSGISGYSGAGFSGYSGYSGLGLSGYSGISGYSGGPGASGTSGYSGSGVSGYSGFSGYSGQTGAGGVVANYGRFFDTTTQTNVAGASGSNVITIDSVSTAQGVSIVSGSRVTFASTGTYLINLLGQFITTGSGSDYKVDVWSALNGANVSQSKFEFTTAGVGGQVLANVQFVVNVTAGDYYQFYWNSANTTMQLQPMAAGTSPTTPAAPSVDLIVAQITFTQSGFSGFSGYSGFSGAGTSGYSGYSGGSGGAGASGISGYSGSGISGYSGSGVSGYSGYSGLGLSGYSGYSGGPGASGTSGYSGSGLSGFSGISGYSGATGASGYSGYSGATGTSGISGYSGATGPSTTINATNSATNAKYYLVGLPALGSNQTAYGFSGNELTYNPSTGDFNAYHVNAYGNIASAANRGAFSYGTLDYSDTNIMASFVDNVDTYAQVILQNTSEGAQASVDLIVSGSSGSATTNYGDFGINSTGFSAPGSLGLPNATYLYSHGGDLVIGTQTANLLRLVTNNNVTDAVTINTANAIAVNGSFGTSGYVLQTNGSGYAPTWVAVSGGGGGTPGGVDTQAQYNISGSFGGITNVIVPSGQNTARINPRTFSTGTSATAVTPNLNEFDQYNWTEQQTTLTINAPTGTPVDGNKLIFRILDNGTSVNLNLTAYTPVGVTLPTATVPSKTTYVGVIYNSYGTSGVGRWDAIAVTTQA
jgi:hypothetical protein